MTVHSDAEDRLYAADLMRLFRIRKSRFYQLEAAGCFDRFKLKPTIGRPAYCGRLVRQYLNGELQPGWGAQLPAPRPRPARRRQALAIVGGTHAPDLD